MKDYLVINISVLLIAVVGLISLVSMPKYTLHLLLLFIFIIPICIVHIIEPTEHRFNLSKDRNTGLINFKTLLSLSKHYMIKYFKSYCVFLMLLCLSSLLMHISILISFSIISNPLEQSLGKSIILLCSSFLVLEGFSILLNIPSCLTVMEIECVNPVKSLIMSKRMNRKRFFKHLLSVSVFAIFLLPIIMISDALYNFTFISSVLRFIYILLVINYTVFDIKTYLASVDKSILRMKKSKILDKSNLNLKKFKTKEKK